MNLAICSIQRDRGPWLKEWIAFHYMVGFRKFYIFLHKCSDNSADIVLGLSKYFDITSYVISPNVARPQLAAYQYCYENFNNIHDWIAFIDGDEFLFDPNAKEITHQIMSFQDKPVGAIGVYWACFGSSGHLVEPVGLITENYRYKAPVEFWSNGHFKSIVRGQQGNKFSVINNAHFFRVENGTFDTLMRPLSHGLTEYRPIYDGLCINHYVTQSRSYYENFKKNSGAADAGSEVIRSEQWWMEYDRNDVFDESLDHLKDGLIDIVKSL